MQHPIYSDEFVMYSEVNRAHWYCAPHAHQCYELLYVFEGQCRIRTAAGTYVAQPHDLVLFRPYQWHEETLLSDVYAVICLRFPSEFVDRHRVPLPDDTLLPTVTALPANEAFHALLDRIVAEYQGCDEYASAMIGAYLFQFAVLLQRELRRKVGPGHAEGAAQAQLRRVLDQHITSAAPIRDLARQVHMSESHFCHQVKALLGVAPKTYVREQRIARACELLHSTAMSIEQIAAALGYDQPTSFFRAFKRTVGVTPGEYRQRSTVPASSASSTARLASDRARRQNAECGV
jgi:AraC-like DNA-binding protein